MASLGDGRFDQRYEMLDILSSEHDIDMRKRLGELFGVALSNAPTDAYDALRELAVLRKGDVFDGCDLSHETDIRCLADAAGHEDGDFGLLHRGDLHCPVRFKHAGDALGVMLVHLAAVRIQAECLLGKHGHKSSFSRGAQPLCKRASPAQRRKRVKNEARR